MKTLEWAYGYGYSLQEAEILSEEEMRDRHLRMELHGKLIGAIGSSINLKDLRWDLPEVGRIIAASYNGVENNRRFYSFLGCSNQAVEVTDEEWDMLIRLNDQCRAEREEIERNKRIAELRRTIDAAEHQSKIYTKSEAEAYQKWWNDVHNEGGDGFVPTVIYQEWYDEAKRELAELLAITG